MPLTIKKISTSELCVGMYVCKLDRPWIETSFLMQGFLITTNEDLERISTICKYVYIDEELSKEHLILTKTENIRPYEDKKNTTPKREYSREDLKKLFINKELIIYETEVGFEEELSSVKLSYDNLSNTICDMLLDISKGGQVNISSISSALNPMVESIIRNPNACIWLARMKNQDSYTYKHSMGASVWSVVLGRQIGLPASDLKVLAVGTLLCDIGKLKLPRELLKKENELCDDEKELLSTHVELSMKEITNSPGINQEIINIVSAHHERFNGQGYPKQLCENDIPIMARIAGIADSYDAMTSQRVYSEPKSPVAAVKELYDLRGIQFQPELIEEFIQAVGLYPAGTLIELSTGEIAVVISENIMRKLRPKIVVLLDRNKNSITNSAIINLMETTSDKDGNSIDIIKSLEPGSFGIKPEDMYF